MEESQWAAGGLDANLRRLLRQIPAAISILRGPKLIIDFINDESLGIIEKPEEDIVGKPLAEAMPELAAQGFTLVLEQVYHSRKRFEAKGMPLQLKRQEKPRYAFFDIVCEPLRDQSDRSKYLIITGFEVTDHIHLQEQLANSERQLSLERDRLQLAIELVNMGTFEYQLGADTIACSPRIRELLGLQTSEELTLSRAKEALLPEDLIQVRQTVLQAIQTRPNETFELKFSLRNARSGQLLSMQVRGQVLYDQENEPVSLMGIMLDVTEQLRTQEALEAQIQERTSRLSEAYEELSRQKQFVDMMIDSSVDLIAAYDTETRFLLFNRKCEEVYQLKREDVLGKRLLEVFPKSKLAHDELIRAIAGESIHNVMYQSPVTARIFETFLLPLRCDGRTEAVLTISHDNTAFVETIRKLDEVEAQNRELEQFVYIASHDLQEPLSTINSFIEVIREDELSELQLDEYLSYIQRSAYQMSELITDLLEYSRIGRQGAAQWVDMNELVQQILENLSSEIDEKKAHILVEPLPAIWVMPREMSLLLQNLITNALKFHQPETHPQIRIAGRQEDDKWHFSVTDNGIGIESRFADRIFVIFQRLHTTDEYEGTGIGLAYCKKIIDLHGGEIWVDSSPQQGSTFHFTIPVKE